MGLSNGVSGVPLGTPPARINWAGFDVFEKKITEIKKIARNARGSLLLFVIGSVLVKYEPILRF